MLYFELSLKSLQGFLQLASVIFDDMKSSDFYLLFKKEKASTKTINLSCFNTSGEETVISEELAISKYNKDEFQLAIKFSELNQNNKSQYKISYLTSLFGASDVNCQVTTEKDPNNPISYIKIKAFNTELSFPIDEEGKEIAKNLKTLKSSSNFTVAALDLISAISSCSLFVDKNIDNSILNRYYFKLDKNKRELMITSGNGMSLAISKIPIEDISYDGNEPFYFNISYLLFKPMLLNNIQQKVYDKYVIHLDDNASYLEIMNKQRSVILYFQKTDKAQWSFSNEEYILKVKEEGGNKALFSLPSDRLNDLMKSMYTLDPEKLIFTFDKEECVVSNYIMKNQLSYIKSFPVIKKQFKFEELELKIRELILPYKILSSVVLAMRNAEKIRVVIKEKNMAIAEEDKKDDSLNSLKILFTLESDDE